MINFRAVRCANLITSPSDIRGIEAREFHRVVGQLRILLARPSQVKVNPFRVVSPQVKDLSIHIQNN